MSSASFIEHTSMPLAILLIEHNTVVCFFHRTQDCHVLFPIELLQLCRPFLFRWTLTWVSLTVWLAYWYNWYILYFDFFPTRWNVRDDWQGSGAEQTTGGSRGQSEGTLKTMASLYARWRHASEVARRPMKGILWQQPSLTLSAVCFDNRTHNHVVCIFHWTHNNAACFLFLLNAHTYFFIEHRAYNHVVCFIHWTHENAAWCYSLNTRMSSTTFIEHTTMSSAFFPVNIQPCRLLFY